MIPDSDLHLLGLSFWGLLFGMAIGVERALRNKPEGLSGWTIVRTLAFIGLASTLAVAAIQPPTGEAVAGVLAGIGFLGAGIMFRGTGVNTVTGVTTAASLFFVAAQGVAVGIGRIWTGGVLCVVAILLLELEELVSWPNKA